MPLSSTVRIGLHKLECTTSNISPVYSWLQVTVSLCCRPRAQVPQTGRLGCSGSMTFILRTLEETYFIAVLSRVLWHSLRCQTSIDVGCKRFVIRPRFASIIVLLYLVTNPLVRWYNRPHRSPILLPILALLIVHTVGLNSTVYPVSTICNTDSNFFANIWNMQDTSECNAPSLHVYQNFIRAYSMYLGPIGNCDCLLATGIGVYWRLSLITTQVLTCS